jgi:hypothetical protein
MGSFAVRHVSTCLTADADLWCKHARPIWKLNCLSFKLPVNQSPAFTSANKTTFFPGAAGAFTVLVTGFPTPVLAAQGAVPSGVSFDTAVRILSGTPAPGTGGICALPAEPAVQRIPRPSLGTSE